ncbi:MAG: aminotransferase class I/II-fold pyridoxal phosphate-dependent enzyme [Betaproteobacteria bacterium]|nr:aminotransferase class I/II-fold pyridoxal phosphate-dependent enzyme [Betaproteobacteria bacterium]
MPLRLASRIRSIQSSPSSAAVDRMLQARRAGRDIVSLIVGEPDFDTPTHIREAACAAIRAGKTRYTQTAGTEELRRAVIDKFKRENGLSYGLDNVIVSSGAKQVLFNALLATLDDGDEVLVPAPYWVSYPDMVRVAGGVPVVIPADPANGLKVSAHALEAAITPRSRWLVLNFPSNPSGTCYCAAEMAQIAAVLERHPQVMLLTDEVYEHIRYDNTPMIHPLVVAPHLSDRTLVVNGVSKTYAMTGWRIGYAAGPVELVQAMTTLQSQSTSNATTVAQAAALAALTGPQDFIAHWVCIYRQRRDRVLQLLEGVEGLRCIEPQGAFYIYVDCAKLIGRVSADGQAMRTDNDVVSHLFDNAGVAVMAGSAFGASPYFRLSIAVAMETLEEACARMARAVRSLHVA